MRTAPAVAPALGWEGRHLLDGRRGPQASLARELLQRGVWNPALRIFANPLIIEGRPMAEPAVYVANHASHADTALVRFAGGSALRSRLAVAAADDYFFSTPLRAAVFTLAVGAFPFPRRGDLGLRRAALLLEGGWSVLLYPQGTRNAGSDYRPGALRLADRGWPIVPVGIAGTAAILPKGARRPTRSPAAVVFGRALGAARLQAADPMRPFVREITAAASRAEALTAR